MKKRQILPVLVSACAILSGNGLLAQLCHQKNVIYDIERSHIAPIQSTVLVIRTTPNEMNRVLESRTGYLAPMPQEEFNLAMVCGSTPQLWIMTDARIADKDMDGAIDPNWNDDVYIVFDYHMPAAAPCDADFPPYILFNNHYVKINLTSRGNHAPDIKYFSPYDKHGILLFSVNYSNPDELVATNELSTFSILAYNQTWRSNKYHVMYHPFERRVVKEAIIFPKDIQDIPYTAAPGSTIANGWVKADHLAFHDPPPCIINNLDDFTAAGAPLYRLDDDGIPESLLFEEPIAIGHYSRTQQQNSNCTSDDLWFLKFADIWNSFNGSTTLKAIYGGNEYAYRTFYGILTLPPDSFDPPPFFFKKKFNAFKSIHFEADTYPFSSESEVSFNSPEIKIANDVSRPFVVKASDRASVSFFTGRLVNSGGTVSDNLQLHAYSGAHIDLTACQVVGFRRFQQIRAEGNDSRIDVTISGDDLEIGYPNPSGFGDDISIYVGSGATVRIVVTGDLHIWGNIKVEPGGRLELFIDGELYTLREPELLRTFTFLGIGILRSKGWNMNYQEISVGDEGEITVHTKETLELENTDIILSGVLLMNAGAFVAKGLSITAKKQGSFAVYAKDAASLQRSTGSNSKLRQVNRGKIQFKHIDHVDLPPMPEVKNACCMARPVASVSEKNMPIQQEPPVLSKQRKKELIAHLYPNPFRENLLIQFTLPESIRHAWVQIYDMKGLLVHRQLVRNTYKENHTITWQAASFVDGMYLIKITDANGNVLMQQKAIKMKAGN